MENNSIINCHVHTFNRAIVPANFLPFWLRPFAGYLESFDKSQRLRELLEKFGKHELSLLVKKYHSFLKLGDFNSQRDIFLQLQTIYPQGTKFSILSMDMEFMQAGKVKQSFMEQLGELAALKKEFPETVLPFVFVHPERKNIFDIVRFCIEEKGFAGIKLYPPLGYYPFDKRLDRVYAYAEQNRLPITTHCARGGIYYKGKITKDMLVHPLTGERFDKKKNKFFTDIYTDPANYNYVLERFPNLKLNLAHFGGAEEWENFLLTSIPEEEGTSWYEKICSLLKKYPNVYSDISYTLYRSDLMLLLKFTLANEGLRKKILYGSDFYMVEQETTERQFYMNLRTSLNEERFKQIAVTNPNNFLFKE